jgi:hypothetical protein
MTGNDNFDQTLEGWLRRQAPRQAPDRVLDAALQRVELEPQRRGWRQRIFGGTSMTSVVRVATFATAVMVVAIFGLRLINQTDEVGPSPVPSPSAQPSESVAPTTAPTATPRVGEPTSKPGAAVVVAELSGGGEVGPFHLVTLLDDGRVITSDRSGATAPMERRLTTAGIQLVRDEMAATGLTDTTADFSPVPNPGVEPPGFIGSLGRLEIGQPFGNPVVITWNLYGDTEADYFQPQPEAEALQALSDRLSTLEEWLPAEAWANANPVPYVPDAYRLTISSFAWGGSLADLSPEVTTLEWPAGVDRGDLDNVLASTRERTRCRLITGAEGTAVIAALEAADATPQDGTNLSFELGERAAPRTIRITLAPILLANDSVC